MVSHRMPTPALSNDAARARTLRRHKLGVTLLLVLAAVIFLACSWWQSHGQAPGWVGYVRAAAEAGMVGGLADWFAVTALFKHPMGLPIPHTALIPKKKDQLGEALSGFVGDNFLNAELITAKVATAEIPRHVGTWLAVPANTQRVCNEAARLGTKALASVDHAALQETLQRLLLEKAAEPTWAPPLGKGLAHLIEEGKVEPVIEELLGWLRREVDQAEDLVISVVDERTPVWAPRIVNQLVGEKLYRELREWVWDVSEQPYHPMRVAVRGWIADLARDLQHDPQMILRIEDWKRGVLASRAVADLGPTLWNNGVEALDEALANPDSPLRRILAAKVNEWGQRLATDAALQEQANDKVVAVVDFLAANYAPTITGIITDTVAAWDAREASDKLELLVGKDLQFIRLNGTLVGSLAGLVIYSVSQLLF